MIMKKIFSYHKQQFFWQIKNELELLSFRCIVKESIYKEHDVDVISFLVLNTFS